MDEINILSKLQGKPNEITKELPVITKIQTLPFEKLTWENFEKFCYQLGAKEMKCIDSAYIYGRRGQKQDGIDLWFEHNGVKEFWQVKKYDEFKKADVVSVGKKFLSNNLKDKADKFKLCVSNYVDDVNVVEEISSLNKKFEEEGIEFAVLNSDKLTILSKKFPDLIESFFGEIWIDALGLECNNVVKDDEYEWIIAETGQVIENGKLYKKNSITTQFNNDGSVNVEYTVPNGKKAYQQVDSTTGTISKVKPPYPYYEYDVIIPENMIISETKKYFMKDGARVDCIVYELKWNKEITLAYNDNGQLVDVEAKCKSLRDDINKKIYFLDESEDVETLK